MSSEILKNFINGQWVSSEGTQSLEVRNPATDELLARTPMSTAVDVDRAVQAARKAFITWREVPAVERARYLFRYKALLDQNFDELAKILTQEHGKTFSEAKGSVKRGVENVEHACGIPTLMMGDSLEDISRGIDCRMRRQPVGVFAAIAPFNFPAMVPLWFWPYAIATGNTFILKPSEQVPLSQQRQFELMVEAGFPEGIMNMVHGGKDVVEAIIDHPDINGISFVGSSPVAKLVYENSPKTGKRVQALGGAKNYIVVMEDAELEPTVAAVTESAFGCAGQRCLAGSTAVLVGGAYDKFKDPLVESAKAIKVGYGMDDGVEMGPVVSARHKERVLSYIEKGVQEGATLLIDGRNIEVEGHPNGQFVGPTIFDDVDPSMTIIKEEIFGPVMAIAQAKDLDDAISLIHNCEYANATSIFTTNGKHARDFQYKAGVSMIGINIGVAAPMAFFPFGGTKNSFFGDTKAHGKDSIRFFTDAKVVISRWF